MALARPLGVLDLPDDVLFVVFDHLLGLEPLDGALQLVCRQFRALLVRPAPVFGPPWPKLTVMPSRRRSLGLVSAIFLRVSSNITRWRAQISPISTLRAQFWSFSATSASFRTAVPSLRAFRRTTASTFGGFRRIWSP